uniref:Thyroglobulin n=1 Tax=Cyprinus carpio TaxID=7962 RepID=A0A8C1WGC4_CYPCA
MDEKKLLCVTFTLLGIFSLTCGKISGEYQLNASCPLSIGLTSCQLQRQQALQTEGITLVPSCLDSGEFEPVQCDASRGQCWCVDQEGMEIYGTRQNGKLSKCECPGTCEVRQRRLLHGIGEPSPPQCSDDGGFLPVQCKFVNTTDRMIFDLLHTFNRDPEVFQTFSAFRKAYPELSSYCFCADSRGREMPSTGVELLLDEVYDTAFSDQTAGSTFAQSNMYRILQRRYLAVQLAVNGRFRCMQHFFENERAAATQAGNSFVPSCIGNGAYVSTQCQSGGQCWCVDADGKEIFGTRQYGVPNFCALTNDCLSERRQALSRLFYGPAGDFSKSKVFSISKETLNFVGTCSPEFQELLANSGLLQSLPELEHPNVGDMLAEVLQGMFPSGALALKALAHAPNPKRLQENLFGGKFLKNAGNFNFTGTVGNSGTLSFSKIFSQVGLMQAVTDLMQLAKTVTDDSASLKLDQEISDAFGRSVNLKNNRDMIKLVSMALENEQFLTVLPEAIKQLKAEESSQLGQLFHAIFQKSDVCKSVTSTSTLYVPQCTEDGRYQEVQCQGSECWCVDSRGLEITGSRTTGSRPRCSSQCEKERQMAIAVKASSSAGSEVFIPKCETDGAYVALQCLGKSCFCVDRSGTKLSLQSSGSSVQCPTSCQATATQQFLSTVHSVFSDPSSVTQLSEVYIPRCTYDGSWHQIQCDGPPEQAIEFYREWVRIMNSGQDLPVSEVLGILRAFARNTEAMASFRVFVSELFKAGQHRVFPVLARFGKFSDIPSDILDGNIKTIYGPSVFLNPLSLWRLIRGENSSYPGPLSDFSLPLGSFHLRQCWCVNPQGDMVTDSKAPVGQIPKCPGPCSMVQNQVSEFLRQAEELISASNDSHVPVGYGFLLAESVYLSPEELEQMRASKIPITQTLLSNTNSALRLAAHSTLHFYWQSRLMANDKDRQSLMLGYQPYMPQCDAYGQWLPNQPMLCVVGPGWCSLQKTLALQREIGVGYEPQCVQDGQRFSPLQCDLSYCWCVSQRGKELPATRTNRSTGQTPACNIPECPLPFEDISHGAVLCSTVIVAGQQTQSCELFCDQGYVNTLPVASFMCDPQAKNWLDDAPLSYACQKPQVLQTVQVSLQLKLSLAEGQQSCSSQSVELQAALLRDMRATGLCSLQLTLSGQTSSVAVCDESSVSLECLNDKEVTAHITFRARLSDLPITSLPDLHDIGERLLNGVKELIQSGSYRSIFLYDRSLALSVPPSFSCMDGYKQLPQSTGCVVCPAGSFSSGGVCTLCPRDTFQVEEGQVFCSPCPSGTSTVAQGAFSASHCLTECQQSKLSCTKKGEFLSAQKDLMSGRWLCVSSQGEELSWTSSDAPMTVEECKGMCYKYLFFFLSLLLSTLHLLTKGHEFSTAGLKSFERLSFRKTGSGVYRTLVFDAHGTTLADVHRFCVNSCSRENCCDGFILNQNVLDGGSIMCGLLSAPSVLQCSEADWDARGMASSSRICGAGVQYSKQLKRFTFNFGGQNFTITLPASSKNKTGYQETLFSFQRIYLWKGLDIFYSIKETFGVLENGDVKVDPERELPSQLYWIFKHQYTFQEAQLWCLKRCGEEQLCHVSDIRDEGPLYFACALYPDTRVCGAYDKPLRQACSLVMTKSLQTAYQKKVSLLGSVKSFYSRVPFKKMVSYSVRSRVSLSSKSIPEGFFECERRCDEDPCCRGIGYVQDSGSDVLCLTLNSLGIQTCGENDSTNWRIQDCSPSKVQTEVYPFGWYEKPGISELHVPFRTLSDLKNWKQLDASSVKVDSSVSAFDIVHISRDIAEDLDKVRDWCLSACEESESCSAVSVDSRESAMRCVMYPDTHTCLPTTSGQRCFLVTKEPAQAVYVRTGLQPELTSVSIPDHGTLLGESEVKPITGSDSKRVTYFLGVPYARPPVGELRFSPPQPADWTGTWNATFSRSSCLQPGDPIDSTSSEDCLYLNVFVASSNAPVLVFFHNSGSGLLDGSYLTAVGNIIVVTASFRVAAFGFLSADSSALPGNYGLQDQAAALGWVQKNIALFGGDPTKVTVGAERNGADIASLHLTSPSASSLFRRALLMGGSVFSPAVVISTSKAQAQTASLARELGCSASDISQLLTCLRSKPAQSINAAQTKLLAVSGPLQAWSPVVDGTVVREKPSVALLSGHFHKAELLLGSSFEDGLISRAKNIKNFEQLQGRADSKTAFYAALSNSLGGDDANAFVKEAATWFYSLQHSPTPSGYNVFSRALENATRDLFIICPAVDMAEFWAANTRSSVHMYHLPEDTAYNSVDLSVPMDVQYLFGVHLASEMRDIFSSKERMLALQIMNYMANFIKSGNPNLPLAASRTSFSKFLPPWPQFMPHQGGRGYKELSFTLSNRKNLQSPQCSFWSQYVPTLITSTG